MPLKIPASEVVVTSGVSRVANRRRIRRRAEDRQSKRGFHCESHKSILPLCFQIEKATRGSVGYFKFLPSPLDVKRGREIQDREQSPSEGMGEGGGKSGPEMEPSGASVEVAESCPSKGPYQSDVI